MGVLGYPTGSVMCSQLQHSCSITSFSSDGSLESHKPALALCRYFREGYLNAMAELIQRELQKFDSPEKTEIFFSAHGVPVSYVEQVCLHSRNRPRSYHMLCEGHLAFLTGRVC